MHAVSLMISLISADLSKARSQQSRWAAESVVPGRCWSSSTSSFGWVNNSGSWHGGQEGDSKNLIIPCSVDLSQSLVLIFQTPLKNKSTVQHIAVKCCFLSHEIWCPCVLSNLQKRLCLLLQTAQSRPLSYNPHVQAVPIMQLGSSGPVLTIGLM